MPLYTQCRLELEEDCSAEIQMGNVGGWVFDERTMAFGFCTTISTLACDRNVHSFSTSKERQGRKMLFGKLRKLLHF